MRAVPLEATVAKVLGEVIYISGHSPMVHESSSLRSKGGPLWPKC